MTTDQTLIIQPDAKGNFDLGSILRGDVRSIDLLDIDLIVTTKGGDRFLLPGGGISAMQDVPPKVIFSDSSASTAQLLGEVGIANKVDYDESLLSTIKPDKDSEPSPPDTTEYDKKILELESQIKAQQDRIERQIGEINQKEQQIQQTQEAQQNEDSQEHSGIATLTANSEGSVEKMVENLQEIEENLHKSDYDYVPPTEYQISHNMTAPPPGVQAPISMTPIVTLFMGNVVGTTVSMDDNPGYTSLYGGGGASGSEATSRLGPRNALQFSPALIEGDDTDCIIYAQGPLVGNLDPAADNSSLYSKQFVLSVAGYFTTLEDITITGVPADVTIVGATDMGDGTWILPAVYGIEQQPFTILYNTGSYVENGNNAFDIVFHITGFTTRHMEFNAQESVRFQYMNVTDPSEISASSLVYELNGVLKEIYVLPSLDQPNIITAGDGNNFVYGGRNQDTITLGDGNNYIEGRGGDDVITVGSGWNIITTGDGDDLVTTSGGGGSIDLSTGNNTIILNTAADSIDLYTLVTSGTGVNAITGGDGLYAITMGMGTNTVSIGDGTDATETTITLGAAANTVTTGDGWHTISVGAGLCSITTGAGADTITVAGGGGSINAGGGTNAITAGNGNYTINVGSGNNTVLVGNGTSSVTSSGDGINNITMGDGAMSITAGAGDNVVVTGTGLVSILMGDGTNTVTTTGGGGSITLGDGGNAITVGGGNYTITTGIGDDVIIGGDGNNTIDAGAGINAITVGDGNNLLLATGGTNTISTGAGDNVIKAGLSTNIITGGSGSNTLDFSDITTTGVTVIVGDGLVHGSATAASVSNDFTGISTIIGTNWADTITLGAGIRTVYAGGGDDVIYCGSGTNTIYAGDGNNTIYGGSGVAYLYGGSGNNTFLTPTAGTSYDGTNGANLASMPNNIAYTITNTSATNPFANATYIPSTVLYSYEGGVATVNLVLQYQLNKVNYGSDNSAMTINLSAGTGAGGTATGATYAFTPTTGYNSINYIAVGNGTDHLTPSLSDTVLVGGTGNTYFYNQNTVGTQNIIMVGNSTNSSGSWDYMYMGAAQETVVGTTRNYADLLYAGTKGVVVNLDSSSHTFSSTLYSSPITVAAYSGSNWGSNEVNSNLSWSTGDFYVPISGTATGIGQIEIRSTIKSLVYAPINYFNFYGSSGDNILYGNENSASATRCLYGMTYGNDIFVGGSGYNIFYVNTSYNIYVILSKSVEGTASANGWISAAQYAKDNAISLSYGGTTYDGFAYGWNNATNPATNPKTYIADVNNVLGYSGNDFIIGNDFGNEINARAGMNTIVTGSGNNIITAIEGSNTIYSTGISNTLNFATSNNAYNGYLGGHSATAVAGVQVFLNSEDTAFFNTGPGGDQIAFWGGSTYDAFQFRTGATGQHSYSLIQEGIVSTISGGSYWSGTANVATTSTFYYDHVYSGAALIYAPAGNCIFIDGVGSGNQAFYGSTRSNVYYVTPGQVETVTLFSGTTGLDILRVPGWGSDTTSGNAFGSDTVFADSSKYVRIDVIDVRSGADNIDITTSSITMGVGSTTNTSDVTFFLSSTDVQNLVDVSSSPTLVLKLDDGQSFVPTGTVDTVVSGNTTYFYSSETHTAPYLLATGTHNESNYYSDVIVYNAANAARVNIHYGAG